VQDVYKKFYLKSSICDITKGIAYSKTAKIAIPYYLATMKDISGPACLPDQNDVTIW